MNDWQQIVARLEGEPAPLSLAKLKNALGIKKAGITEAHFRAALDEAVNRGKAFAWPKTSYWHVDPATHTQTEILELCSKKALKKAEIKVKGRTAKDVGAVIDKLLEEKKLAQYPALAGTAKLLAATPRVYGAYVEEFVIAKLQKAGLATDGVFGTARTITDADLESKVWDALMKLEPQVNLPVSAGRLRAALGGADKGAVDSVILHLRARRKVYLSQHDHPEGMSEAARDELVDGRDGRFYVAVTRLES